MTKTPQAKIKTRGNPGRRLEEARRKSSFTRQDVAHKLNVPVSVIKYLDRWELDNIDAQHRHRQTIREYALMVGLNPSAYESEIPYDQPKQDSFKPLVVFSRLSVSAIAVIVGSAVLGFLAWRVYIASARPILDINQPAPGLTTSMPTAEVSGHTSEQAQVYVNGFNVPVDEQGNFSTSVILEQGANTITVTAINSFGRQSESRRVVDYTP